MRRPRPRLIGSFNPFRSLLVALQFLTLIPVRVRAPLAPGELGGSLVFFPLVGAMIGWILALVGFLLTSSAPPLLTAALIAALGIALTGLLHFDGLMDTIDGLFGGAKAEERLAIMRDSRVGSFAVAAGVCDMLLRFASVNALADGGRLMGLVMAATASRFAMVYVIVAFRPARDSGLGSAFQAEATRRTALLAGLVAVVVGYVAIGPISLALIAVTVSVAQLSGMVAMRKVDGLTGDIYGAVNEIVEVAILVSLALLWEASPL